MKHIKVFEQFEFSVNENNKNEVQFAKDMLDDIKYIKSLLPKAEKACKSLIADPTLFDNARNPAMTEVSGFVEACNMAANGEAGQYFYD